MAMETVDQHLITQFSDMMHVKAQQLRSRLRPYVTIKRMTGDQWAYDGIGQVEARELSGRFNPTNFDDIEHFRRRVSKRRFVVTLPMDRHDVEGMLTDPQGEYANACVAAMERVFDKVVYDAAFATVYTGRDFSTAVTFASDGGVTVDATGGLTLAKLLEVRQNFLDNEVGNDIPVEICMSMTGEEQTAMLQLSTLTSGDYSREFALEKGELIKAVGMHLIPFGGSVNTPIIGTTGAGGTRSNLVLASGGIVVGIAREWEITVKDRPDYVDTKQIQITGVLGAVRTEGKRVIKFNTADAA